MEGQAEFSFSHALVRDVCYAQIPKSQRAERHRRAAAWIEDLAADRVEDHAEILAAHYATALDLALATGDGSTAETRAKAVRFLTLAGDRALGMDVEAAEWSYARGLEITGPDDEARPRLLTRHARALTLRGRFAEAGREYEQAVGGFREHGDEAAMVVAIGRLAGVLQTLGEPRFADLFDQAASMLDRLPASAELVEAMEHQAMRLLVASRPIEALAFTDRAIALSSELDLPPSIGTLTIDATARAYVGHPGAIEAMRRTLESAVAQGAGATAAIGYNNLGELLGPNEGPRAWMAVLEAGLDLAERRGIEEAVLLIKSNAVQALVELGEHESVLALNRELEPPLEATGDTYDLIFVRASVARVLSRQGDPAAKALADWALERARESNDAQAIAIAHPVSALLELGSGDSDLARALLRELEAAPDVRDSPTFVRAIPDAVRGAVAAGMRDLGSWLVEEARFAAPQRDHARVTAHALLAEDRGDLTGAEQLFADAAERWREFETPWELGQALLGRGRCLVALGRPAEAVDVLREAREVFTSLGAAPSVGVVDDLLARAIAATS
jgi:tetratricopeptide (TPR) repeat protein